MQVVNGLYPTPKQHEMLKNDSDDRSIQLVNLFKFRERAIYKDGRETTLSGREAYSLYGKPMLEVLENYGAEVVFSSEVTGLIIGEVDELWDSMVIVKYPSRQVLLDMTSSEEFLDLIIHREAGLEGQLNIETRVPR